MGIDRVKENPWETHVERVTVGIWEKLAVSQKVQMGRGMERVRDSGRSRSPVRAACSLSYLEPAPLLLGAEIKLVLGSAPPPAGCAGR